ncbi:MAG: multicopper oxidase domain-containing protein, partial [Steroidobacteraceae bacterium]
DMPGMSDTHAMAGAGATPGMDRKAGMADMHMAGMDDMPGMDHAASRKPMPRPGGLSGSTRLDDPGVGLRGNGRRVLTYADLHTLGGSLDPRETSRDVKLHLTGNMERFIWSINGRKYSQAQPLRFDYGERVRLVVVNETMMNHPMHLHGMWGEVLAGDGAFQVRKHTVLVQPGQRMVYAVSADALGRWAYHCHMLYHMEAGMFREVRVERA